MKLGHLQKLATKSLIMIIQNPQNVLWTYFVPILKTFLCNFKIDLIIFESLYVKFIFCELISRLDV